MKFIKVFLTCKNNLALFLVIRYKFLKIQKNTCYSIHSFVTKTQSSNSIIFLCLNKNNTFIELV